MPIIEVVGLASKTIRSFEIKPDEGEENLLQWLRRHGITVASSCDGAGICRKCIIQNDLATCEVTVNSFLQQFPDGRIFISYL